MLSLLDSFLKWVFETKLYRLFVVPTVLAFQLGLNPIHINMVQVFRTVNAAETDDNGELYSQDH